MANSNIIWGYSNFDKFINDLTEVPNVTHLELNDTNITLLPQEIKLFTNLINLDLETNQLTKLPLEIGLLTNLEELDLNNNQLLNLPQELGNLKKLIQLHLNNNELTELPLEIGQLSNLEQLELDDNLISKLPQELSNLNKLGFLGLKYNMLTELPEDFGNLNKLEQLDLSHNNLLKLPQNFGKLSSLTYLNLNTNKLTKLPSDIGELANLEVLLLNNNQLTTLPLEIKNLTKLKLLNITGNPLLTTIPPELELMPNLEIHRDQPTKNTQDLQPLNQPTLNIFKNVLCNNYLEGEDNTIPDFLTKTLDENPFIVEHKNIYSGNALGWLLKEFSNETDPREFVECKDETPSEWQGNSYAKYIKPGGRTFVNIRINGSNILVLKPDWFWYGPIPETRVFHLEPQAPVKKYMTNHLLPNMRPDFNALGADHCNQTSEMIPYKLVEITEKSAPAFATAAKYKTNSSASAVGGKRRKIYKTLKRKQPKRKHKKTKHKKTKRKKTKTKRNLIKRKKTKRK